MLALSTTISAKEWKRLELYQSETKNETLLPSDWLKSDRLQNTVVWQRANAFNLQNDLPQEYTNISQRRDFYKWLFETLEKKGHEVVWVKMAYFISKKMHLMEVFPYHVFIKKTIKSYAVTGNALVFNNAFNELNELLDSDTILKDDKAVAWDKTILHKEQCQWLDSVYITMDTKNLKTLERIAKRKFLYSLVVPKAIAFKGILSNAEDRYLYAVEVLKPYCENAYK
tara:strand:+ start:29232 stop:29912 length:681 start_codon:yes stop_codon:yes gene_type:complete